MSLSSAKPDDSLARVGRLTLKELRETLRDRRTIMTLVLMPLLVYPLLSLGFKQLLVANVTKTDPRVWRIHGHERLRRRDPSGDQRVPLRMIHADHPVRHHRTDPLLEAQQPPQE